MTGVTISNGLAWSSRGKSMFFIDTPTLRIDTFDYDSGTGLVGNRRSVVEVPAAAGNPVDMWASTTPAGGGSRSGAGQPSTVTSRASSRPRSTSPPYVTYPTVAGPASTSCHHDGVRAVRIGVPAGAGDLYVAKAGVTGPAPFVIDVTAWTEVP